MEPISKDIRLGIVQYLFAGLIYNDIVNKMEVSVGTVANVLKALIAGEYPEIVTPQDQVAVLRELAVKINKEGYSLFDVFCAVQLIEAMRLLGVTPDQYSAIVDIFNKLESGEITQGELVSFAVRLSKLERHLGIPIQELQTHIEQQVDEVKTNKKSLEDLHNKYRGIEGGISKLQQQKESIEKEIVHRERAVERLTEAENALNKFGPTVVAEHIRALQELSSDGYKPERLQALANIQMLIDEYDGDPRDIYTLLSNHTQLAEKVQWYKRRIHDLEWDRRFFTGMKKWADRLDEIYSNGYDLECNHCGEVVKIELPSQYDINVQIDRNMPLVYQCRSCRKWIQIHPMTLLTMLGRTLLIGS